jgi:hypothetical protein
MHPISVTTQSFHRPDLMAIGLHRENETRTYGLAVHQHRASATDSVFAPDVCASEPKVVTEKVAEENPRLNRARENLTVDRDGDFQLIPSQADPPPVR